MKFLNLLLFLFVFGCGVVCSQTTPPKNILGIYKSCSYNCDFLKLNSDYTFDFLWNPGVGDPQRAKGEWHFIDKDKIHLKTFNRPLEAEITEKTNTLSDEISIRVIDQNGAIIPAVEITAVLDGQNIKVKTDEDGRTRIPKIAIEIEVSLKYRKFVYQIKKKDVSELNIMLTIYLEPYFDNSYVIGKNKICQILDSGEVAEYCYEKTKKYSKERLFPEK